MPSDNILEIENLTKTYPGVVALDHVSMQVRRGEIHALMGENGAGKSTLIKAITGALKPDFGVIRFDGKEFSSLTPAISAEVGIGAIYQEFNLVYQLSVAENIFLGNYPGKATVDFKEMDRKAAAVLQKIGVNIPPRAVVGGLTVGRQQIVEIARSLVKDIKLLIMDEPSAPLTTTEVEQMLEIVRTLRDEGMTIIYISHRMEEVFGLADRISVFRDGKYVTTLTTSQATMGELIRYMVGRDLDNNAFPARVSPIGEEVLRAEHLTGNGVRDINFSLHKGEILGFAGLLGAGRTETMQLLFGAAKVKGGKIFLNGQEVHLKDTEDALDRGIGLIPEDRKLHGVFLPMTIAWNVSISAIKKKLMRGIIVDKRREKALAKEYIQKLNVKTPSMNQLVGNLSGGNQQKVVVAKVMATDAAIMIFDEPTRGIDVGAKQEMYALIRQMAEEGNSVIMVSSEMAEIIGLSDRVVVLHEGDQMGILERDELTQEKILTLASGIKS